MSTVTLSTIPCLVKPYLAEANVMRYCVNIITDCYLVNIIMIAAQCDVIFNNCSCFQDDIMNTVKSYTISVTVRSFKISAPTPCILLTFC